MVNVVLEPEEDVGDDGMMEVDREILIPVEDGD
jgi:hypothetical protein